MEDGVAADQPRRVLLKLSGEAFGGGKVGIDTQVIRRIAEEIVPAVRQGVQVAIVVGGGNFFRGAELQQAGIDRSRGDYMGMLGTVMNCLALQDFLEQEGQATRVQTAITMGQVAEPYIPLKAIRHLEKGRVVIFGAGAGMPYFSTDTVSIQRSLEIHCDEVVMGKNGVDGVYTSDPRKDADAKRFATLSYNRALVDNLAVMAFDHGHAFAELGRPQSCGISAGSTADYRDVKSFTHVRLLCARTKTIPIVIPYARRRAELWSK